METVIVNTNGQIQIPAALRKKFNIQAKSKILLIEKNGELVIRPFNKSYLNQFVGILKGKGDPVKGLMQEKIQERKL